MEFNGKKIELYDNDATPSKNIFTTIVGRNGSGKSRLLRELIRNHLRLYVESNSKGHSCLDPTPTPEKIIAISTSPFDRFPMPSLIGAHKGDEFVQESQGYYFYQGLRGLYGSNLSMSYMMRTIAGVIRGLSTDTERLGTVLDVLDYLGFQKSIKVRFVCGITRKTLERISLDGGFDEYIKGSRSIGTELRRVMTRLEDAPDDYKLVVVDAIRHLLDEFGSERAEISISESGTLNSLNGKAIEERFVVLMECGVLRLRDLLLHKKELSKPFRISDASSGEQCVVLTMLGIAARIKDNSLICIDEPEICLHPEWQERYIELLMSTFRSFRSCHFIIATHSPQIVSNLESNNCFVLDLHNNKLINAEKLNKRSADFQLANVFNAPGYKNEYLMRELLAIFGKMSTGKQLTEENNSLICHAKNLKHAMDATDPVRQLVQLLEEALDGNSYE